MRYLMKQKLFCLGDDFTIKNDQGEDVFFVDGKVFSIGAKLSSVGIDMVCHGDRQGQGS
jgi:uncharacterized protein YxjI